MASEASRSAWWDVRAYNYYYYQSASAEEQKYL